MTDEEILDAVLNGSSLIGWEEPVRRSIARLRQELDDAKRNEGINERGWKECDAKLTRSTTAVSELEATVTRYSSALKSLCREVSIEVHTTGHEDRCGCDMCASLRRARLLLGIAR